MSQDLQDRIQRSFDAQGLMATLGARLQHVQAGEVHIALPFSMHLSQQMGFLHAGAITSIVDSACGYAAFTLAPADHSILTVEYKLNLVAPGQGGALVARAEVVRPGRTLVVTRADVYAERAGAEKLVATALSTMMLLAGRSDAQAA